MPSATPEPVNMAESVAATADSSSTISEELFEIQPENFPGAIISNVPATSHKLGIWAVISIMVNRMIGSGIFNSPTTVIKGTGSTGVALLLWSAGAIVVLAGTHLMIEFGLSIPRYTLDGIDQAIPQNGGPVVFLQYLYPRPAYRPGTVIMITCVFGMAHVLLGNMAGNCLSFAIKCTDAAGLESSEHSGAIRGIAIAIATFACLINAVSVKGSIWIGHIFAVIKVTILMLMVILGFCVWGGALQTQSLIHENLSPRGAFEGISDDSLGYISAFLAIIFAWDGFDQPVWILEEIGAPRRTVPRGTWTGVSIVIVLYMMVNVAYMIVVPKDVQLVTENIALEFFRMILGRDTESGNAQAPRILQVLIALSSFGNILIMPLAAARMKQEIAKEGVLPFAFHIGGSKGWPTWLMHGTGRFGRDFLNHDLPLGALSLLWFGTVLSIVVTVNLKPSSAYQLLVDLYAYTIPCFCGALLSFGMLKLRFSREEQWRRKSKANPYISIMSATVFFIGCAFPVIAYWVPPKDDQNIITGVVWYITPTVAVAVLLGGVAWFIGLRLYMSYRSRRGGLEFHVQKVPEFDSSLSGGVERVREIVYQSWAIREATAARLAGGRTSSTSSLESY